MSLPSLDGEEYPWDNEVIIPVRPFLYSLEQIATLLALTERELRPQVFFAGRQRGPNQRKYLTARNISAAAVSPVWRVAEAELVRWLKFKGFRVTHRGEILD